MLDLNITFWFQLANFFIALYFLNILLIKPVRSIIQKRNDLMDNMAQEADNFHKEASDRLTAYEEELARARQQAGLTREESKSAGLAELQAILGTAQKSAHEMLEQNRAILREQTEKALTELRNGIDGFSTRVGEKLLG